MEISSLKSIWPPSQLHAGYTARLRPQCAPHIAELGDQVVIGSAFCRAVFALSVGSHCPGGRGLGQLFLVGAGCHAKALAGGASWGARLLGQVLLSAPSHRCSSQCLSLKGKEATPWRGCPVSLLKPHKARHQTLQPNFGFSAPRTVGVVLYSIRVARVSASSCWGNVSGNLGLAGCVGSFCAWLGDKVWGMCAYGRSLSVTGACVFGFMASEQTPASSWCWWQIAWQILTGRPQIDFLLKQLKT